MYRFARHLAATSAVALTLAAAPASAALIVDGGLTLDTNPSVFYQQTSASPCVIGGNNCQNPPTFAQTLAGSGGNGSVFDSTSPLYTALQISTVAGGPAFVVGLDYNQTNDAQTLNSFEARYYNGAALLSSQLFDVATLLQVNNNGVGYSDFLLSGFVIPAGATNVQFQANWFNNDGPDRYFIIGAGSQPCRVNCTQAPEPASLALFGLVALGAGIVRRRKK